MKEVKKDGPFALWKSEHPLWSAHFFIFYQSALSATQHKVLWRYTQLLRFIANNRIKMRWLNFIAFGIFLQLVLQKKDIGREDLPHWNIRHKL